MKKIILSVLLTTAIFGICGFLGLPNQTVAEAGFDVYDFFSEEHIKIYEEDIASQPVVSNLNEKQLAKTALNYNVTVLKLKKMLIFQHAMQTIGRQFSLTQIANMDNGQLLSNAKDYIEWLKANRSPEELKALKNKFKAANEKLSAEQN